MGKYLFMAVFAAVLMTSCFPKTVYAAMKVTIVNMTSRQVITADELVEILARHSQVIVFNEFHDQPLLHALEESLWEKLYEQKQAGIALSMEMFERDVQPVLDAYVAGKISEEEFLAKSHPWPRYATDYRPMVNFAKEHHLRVLAANIPRPLAAAYAKSGVLPENGKNYLPRKIYAPEGDYKKRFFATLENLEATTMKVPPARYQSMYQAQCLKDDTMAESMADYLRARPGQLIYHVQGAFHGAYRLGVVEKLQDLMPGRKISVLTPIYREKGQNDADIIRQYSGSGDYLLILEK